MNIEFLDLNSFLVSGTVSKNCIRFDNYTPLKCGCVVPESGEQILRNKNSKKLNKYCTCVNSEAKPCLEVSLKNEETLKNIEKLKKKY